MALHVDIDYPEMLALIARTVYEELELEVPDNERRGVVAFRVAEKVRITHGGGAPYIQKGDAYEKAKKYRAIYAAFNGSNLAAVARKFNLTEMRVRQILAEIDLEKRVLSRIKPGVDLVELASEFGISITRARRIKSNPLCGDEPQTQDLFV
ncbi:MAG: hypothetical protein RIR00_147 [Pseudomonadota bacterium]|jgi:Mor family transcriptional regulator